METVNNTAQVVVPEAQRGTAARSLVYRALSALFFYPQDAGPAAAEAQAVARSLRDRLAELPYPAGAVEKLAQLLDELDELGAATDLPPLASTYTALFDNCRGRAAVSLYEKDYGNGEAKMVWEELIRFYEHFGLTFDVRQSRDWPDHIGTELEFMHYLSFLEAAAPQAERPLYVRAQQDFLARRLGCWVGRFAGQVEGMSEAAPYAGYARLAAAFVAAEAAFLGIPLKATEHWVPMPHTQTDAGGRTIIPIADLSETGAFY